MSQPAEFGLLELATPYALDAISDTERTDIEQRLSRASRAIARAFDAEVRAVRAAMAAISSATAIEPPMELRARVLSAVGSGRQMRWRSRLLAAAAALVIGLAAAGVGLNLRPAATPTTAEQVFAAPDVRTTSEPIPAGGTATVVYSRQKAAGVLVMNNVAPPAPGTVYQMWLFGGNDGTRSAGTINAAAVSSSTTAVLPNLGTSTTLVFTVEPGDGSPQPTGAVFAKLPLK